MEVGKLIQNVEQQEGAHGDQRQAIRLHAVVGRVRRRAVAGHGAASRSDLLRDRDHGDGAVNVQSRVQMDLFKARQKAQKEYEGCGTPRGLAEVAARAARRGLNRALFYPRTRVAGTAGNTILELRPELEKDVRSAGLPPPQKPRRSGVASTVTFRNGSIPLIAVGGAGSAREGLIARGQLTAVRRRPCCEGRQRRRSPLRTCRQAASPAWSPACR